MMTVALAGLVGALTLRSAPYPASPLECQVSALQKVSCFYFALTGR